MNALEKRLVNNYTILLMGKVITEDELPNRVIIMSDGLETTLKEQVIIERAKRENEKIEDILDNK